MRVVIDVVSVMVAYTTINTDNISFGYIGTRYVILAKHWMWLSDDGLMWTETFWSSFHNFNCFNNLRILELVCISWTIKCLILLMHGTTMKYIQYISAIIHIAIFTCQLLYFFFAPRLSHFSAFSWHVDTSFRLRFIQIMFTALFPVFFV